MATYQDFTTIAMSTVFQARVWTALSNASINIYSEAISSAVPANQHDIRRQYATRVFQSTAVSGLDIVGIARSALTISSFSTQAGSTLPNQGLSDAEIQTAINSVYNALCGA